MLLKNIKNSLGQKTFEILVFWLVICLIIKASVFYLAFSEVQAGGSSPILCAWDCPYYEEIASKGYSYSPVHGTMAFFPLFPVTVQFLRNFIPGDFAWTGASMNFLLFGVVIAMFLLFCQQLDLKYWWLPSVIWSLDRFSFWATVPYTEVIFLLWVFVFLLILRKSQRPPALLLAAFVGGFSTASRLVGVALIGALGLGNFKYFLKKPLLGLICLVLGLWGVAAFWGYLEWKHGDWKLSLITTSHWGRHFDALGIFRSGFFLLKSFYFPTVLSTGLTLFWLVKSPLKIFAHEKWLFGILFLIPIMNSIPISITRYFSILFLGHIAWAYYIEKGFISAKPWQRILSWALTLAIIPEFFWQAKLLAKFMRNEVFNWAG